MKRILIIEDDAATLKLYKDKLAIEGLEVFGSNTGRQGLIIAKHEKPDLIILDIMLPGGTNGFDVLEALKKDEKLKNTPVVMLTNLDTEEKVAKEIGAADYIVKANTTLNEIVGKMKTYLGN